MKMVQYKYNYNYKSYIMAVAVNYDWITNTTANHYCQLSL